MAKIITGQRPQIEVKSYAYEVTKLLLVESRGELEQDIQARASRAGVPEEATLTREDDRQQDIIRFTWRWWEVTL
ncbi:hypothetical protein PBI_LUCKY3_41 [Microbacterium phage Lucky3]|uniref:Uncharacterized protein n=2 Tax=Kojivirus golden TaxID=2560590 RepID=A0A2P1CFW6_9CAUD|nr:hypothetical protein FDJ42_gp41 [Microbacterium phage Golden]AVJ49788.1 hypothetical protein PBI_GOLDEN_41 [Microbacterium phage Golden]AVJ50098.1 hypothetical protein PBI_LUCKY3_41 [Microbacterium phage Lucky3]WNM68014.1 hypothetical protein SEA_SIRVICTOR_42 [Microbacterium phage SirVictor]WNM74385.1 hypothetical protein SEA_GUETZIE_42 [Microbacterium phage Guetzie]